MNLESITNKLANNIELTEKEKKFYLISINNKNYQIKLLDNGHYLGMKKNFVNEKEFRTYMSTWRQ